VEDRWLFLHVADVTGHGTPAALCASFAKGSIDAIHRTLGSFTADDPPLEKVHERLNDILNREGSDRLLITTISIAIDLVDGMLWYVNSGHPPGVLIDAKLEKLTHLRALGTPILGLAAEFTPTKRQCLPIHPGDYVILYTDGVAPAIKNLLRNVTHARTRKGVPTVDLKNPQAMLDHLLHLNTEKMPKELVGSDDVTLVVIRFSGRGIKEQTPPASQSKLATA
jgi:sigma-B regulation protein RsbU (phosphoserine phosphatase)